MECARKPDVSLLRNNPVFSHAPLQDPLECIEDLLSATAAFALMTLDAKAVNLSPSGHLSDSAEADVSTEPGYLQGHPTMPEEDKFWLMEAFLLF